MTSGLLPDEVQLAPSGHIYVAETGVVLPDDVETALTTVDPDYKELGFCDETGVSINPQMTLTEIAAWQSSTAVATAVNTTGLEIKFKSIQVNEQATGLFFFGEAWDPPETTGNAKLTVPTVPSTYYRTLVVEWNDHHNNNYRLVVPKTHIKDSDAMPLKRNESMCFGVTLNSYNYVDVDYPDGILAYVLTDNPDLGAVPAAS